MLSDGTENRINIAKFFTQLRKKRNPKRSPKMTISDLLCFGGPSVCSVLRNVHLACCGVSKARGSATLRAKNSPQDCFLNVALRPPPVAEEGSKSARQNKEYREPVPRAKRDDYILARPFRVPDGILRRWAISTLG